jgi:hypothetical protein
MKNGLLLTLKQLIKLGVINFKKKKRRISKSYKSSRTKQIDAFEKGTNSIPFNPQNKRYADFIGSSSSPQMTPYTDNLRLRDSNDNFNTRLLEYKNDLTSQKLLLNDQQEKQRELENDVDIGRQIIMRELRPITYDYGYVNDDEVDVAETYGSDSFEAQTRQSQTILPSRYSAIQDYEDEGILTREEYRQQRERESAKLFESPFKDNLAKEENFAEDSSEPIGKDFGLLTQPSDDEGEAEQLTPQNPQIRIKEKKRAKPSFREEKEENEDQVPQQNEEAVASENTSMKFPKVDVPKHNNYPFSPEKIPYAKTKPSVAEVQQWKEWYLQLGFKDPSILKMNTRSSYIKPIQAKLLDEYKKLRGDKDPSILRSKDPRIIYKAIKQRLAGLG